MRHACTVARDVLAYLVGQIGPVVLDGGIVQHVIISINHHHRQVETIHGTTYLPVECQALHIDQLTGHHQQVVGFFHLPEASYLEGTVCPVIVERRKLYVLQIQEVKTLRILVLPFLHLIEVRQIAVLVVKDALRIKCHIGLICVHVSSSFYTCLEYSKVRQYLSIHKA